MIELDGIGITGSLLQTTFTFATIFGALLFFLYCYRKGILNYSEEASEEMVNFEELNEERQDGR